MTPEQKLSLARARNYARGRGKLTASDTKILLTVLDSYQPKERVAKIHGPEDIETAFEHLKGLQHEELWACCLSSQNRVVDKVRIATGGAAGCAIVAADIFRHVLLSGATAFVLVHNHPSGDPTPSRDDIVMTRTVQTAAKAIGVYLLDHVVVATGGAKSCLEES